MKKFTKYFGGIYMKYWYIAAAVVVVAMILSMLNNRSIVGYKLTIYDNAGNIITEEVVPTKSLANEISSSIMGKGENKLPITKKIVPIRKVNL